MLLEFIATLDLQYPPSKRTLFEEIIPRVAELLDLGKEATYEEIVVSFLEAQAMDLGMERFKIYSFTDFFNEIIERSKTYDEKRIKLIK